MGAFSFTENGIYCFNFKFLISLVNVLLIWSEAAIKSSAY